MKKSQGLYDPAHEHDACGVGIVANINGEKSYDIIRKAIRVLVSLEHRGACGCDPNTGDGAGLMFQLPHAFLKNQCHLAGISVPDQGTYAVGMVFLPRNTEARRWCERTIEKTIWEEGQLFLGWRDVPVDYTQAGEIATEVSPLIRQFFVTPSHLTIDQDQFERKLYVIRKVIENAVDNYFQEEEGDDFYIVSLSSKIIVYKGLLRADQLASFYRDLSDESIVTSLALIHSRYSTNTLGSWRLAHPYRLLCHNGEINTIRGNQNWMRARESLFSSPLFGDDIAKLSPIIREGSSDTAGFDNALELLISTGRSLPHAMMMMIPEAWENHESMSDAKKAFYSYHSCLMEPWDGPALIAACDGDRICTTLDRNGLRPFRYAVTKDNFVVGASEAGVLDIPPENIVMRGRLEPGRLFLIDTLQGRIITDEEIKQEISTQKPYRQWLTENMMALSDLPEPPYVPTLDLNSLRERQRAFGYTSEELKILLGPMAAMGEEPIGSMGNDTPLAVLSEKPQLLSQYFKQLFAQVTNPPLDAIREKVVTSLECSIGSEDDLFCATPEHCRQIKLERPVLSNEELARIRALDRPGLKSKTLPALFRRSSSSGALEVAVDKLCREAGRAIREQGATLIVLSDRGIGPDWIQIPILLATAAVHHYLIREGLRTRAAILVESGEPREVMQCCLLIGYGANALNPYLALETVEWMSIDGVIEPSIRTEKAQENLLKAMAKGVLKTMSKMGISTIKSYHGAQIFEIIGLKRLVVEKYFTGTSSRIEGIGIAEIEAEYRKHHDHGYPDRPLGDDHSLVSGGYYQWRNDGEHHFYNPHTIALLQASTKGADYKLFNQYTDQLDNQARIIGTLRGLFEFKQVQSSVPIEEVEPASEIIKRFSTGAMSYGSISKEAHETLAIAMNRIGARSNSGEGGEDPDRYKRDENGDWRNSAIKQVASGRFGVTSNYLVNATDLQIKMAQGAKPGEGGQLPNHKVLEEIARVRKSTPGVGLISPPPHHDIYSIEDLAQLIHDLKSANDRARIHVKLVAEAGVGTVAAGVSKGKADVVLISGYDGGTGASPESSMKHAGVPWELGLAETQQVLVHNDLRGRIVVQADGQLKTGRDVAVACLLGAEEFGFATAALVVSGCIMLRKCHLNTCSVGIATQDEELRKRFIGKPENVINFMVFIAEQMREYMAQLGFRTVNEMVGRTDCLGKNKAIEYWKAKGLDFTSMLMPIDVPENVARYCCQRQDHRLETKLDQRLIENSKEAIDDRRPVVLRNVVHNTDRTVGAMLSAEVSRRHGEDGLPEHTIRVNLYGSAGQSFGAFLASGISLFLEGESNDYTGKGLSGGIMAVFPPQNAGFVPTENVIIGNVALYGATGGQAFFRGRAGERFAVRNSGAQAVIEGVGDHGCEYMTGGCVVVIGPVGRNFAAGMSGGVSYILDEKGIFPALCNKETVDLEPLMDDEDIEEVRQLIETHVVYTGSDRGEDVLSRWMELKQSFIKVMPHDYRKALQNAANEKAKEKKFNGTSHLGLESGVTVMNVDSTRDSSFEKGSG